MSRNPILNYQTRLPPRKTPSRDTLNHDLLYILIIVAALVVLGVIATYVAYTSSVS